MSGVNKAIIVGRLGNDPEVRYMPSGGAVTNISVATSEKWKDKQSGQEQERTEWHRVVLFNRLGEVAGEYLKKGSQVYIEGSIQTNKYQDKNSGEDRYSTQIVARSMQLLGDRGNNQSSPQPQQNQQQRSQQGAPPASTEFDDEIPFSPIHSAL